MSDENKVRDAIRVSVIDWLQWCDFKEPKQEALAQNALTFISELQSELAKERERRESAESILRTLIPTMYVMRVKDDGTTEDARMTIPYHEALAKKHFKKYEGDKT